MKNLDDGPDGLNPPPAWETVGGDVQRISVPGGWLYRTAGWVELPSAADEPNRGYYHWSSPVFVAYVLPPAVSL